MRPLVYSLAISLVLVFSDASLAQAQPTIGISYALTVQHPSLRLCTGETAEILAYISRQVYRRGRQHPAQVLAHGGRVVGVVGDEDVGRFEPAEAGRDVRGTPLPRALYEFVALAPGRTTIDFIIDETGDEHLYGNDLGGDTVSVSVVVTDCFEAFTSGLGLVFTVKDMKDLIQPFTLEAHSPPTVGITTKSQAMFFMPSGPRNQFLPSFSGLYVSVLSDTTTLGGRQITCVDVLTGPYELEFHITPDDPRFRSGIDVGNLQLWGNWTKFCPGGSVSGSYPPGGPPGFLIAIKPTLP
jgi:hypothetical protein